MSQLYEIHISITVKTALDEMKWYYYCKDNNYKIIRVLNDKGQNDIQNMISKWCTRDTEKEVIEYANTLAENMSKAGFDVCRVKVEGMMMNREYDSLELKNVTGKYWEFHFKIIIENSKELERLLSLKELNSSIDIWKNVALSMSSYGTTRYPIMTIRLHNGTCCQAVNIKNQIIDVLKENNFHIYDKLQSECAIYDSYPEEDAGWII